MRISQLSQGVILMNKVKDLRGFRDSSPEFTLRACEKIRSWFDRLTTNGFLSRSFTHLAVRPELRRRTTAIFSQPLSVIVEMTEQSTHHFARAARNLSPT